MFSYHIPVTEKANEYKAVTLEEVIEVVKTLPDPSPGPDNTSAAMIKIMFNLCSYLYKFFYSKCMDSSRLESGQTSTTVEKTGRWFCHR